MTIVITNWLSCHFPFTFHLPWFYCHFPQTNLFSGKIRLTGNLNNKTHINVNFHITNNKIYLIIHISNNKNIISGLSTAGQVKGWQT